MAAIGKIRERSGLLLVIIGLALAAFVLGDLFQNLGKSNNANRDKIALINGEKLGIQDFSMKVSQQADLLVQRNKKNLTTEESYNNTIEVWNSTKRDIILSQQMTELGLIQIIGNQNPQISMDEFMGNIYSATPHREVVRFFTGDYNAKLDQETVKGFFDFLERGVSSENQEEKSKAVEYTQQWNLFKSSFKDVLLETKYNNLIVKAYYLPKALAEFEFEATNVTNKVAYFGANYKIITDEEAVPSDADYQAYYEEHKKEFEAEMASRKIEYITWNVTPSQEDIKDLQLQIEDLYKEMETADKENIQYTVNKVDDNSYDSSWIGEGNLSVFIDSAAFAAEPGTVLGPWNENNAYHIAKVIAKDSRPDSLKASQILISYSGAYGEQGITRTKISARALADSIKDAIIADPAAFEALLSKSDDPSAIETKGEFGWFKDGSMITPINQACIKNNIGDIIVVESTIGFSVIRIDDKKENTPKIRIAKIDLPITFSQKTFNNEYSKAIKFAAVNQNYEAFDTASANEGLNVVKGEFVNDLSAGIRGLTNSRDVVKWMFDEETNIGSVSKVFDFEDKVVVAVLTEIRPKGLLPLEDVKEYISPLVMRSVKADLLKAKVANVTSISQATEFNAVVDTTDVNFGTYSLQKYGPEPSVTGRMIDVEPGKLVGPIEGDQGLYFFTVLEKGSVPAEKDLNYVQQRSRSTFAQGVYQNQRNPQAANAYTPLEKNAEIENNMFFFY